MHVAIQASPVAPVEEIDGTLQAICPCGNPTPIPEVGTTYDCTTCGQPVRAGEVWV